ncbi:MAG: HAD family hydrolase [Acidobacteriota bacterium]|nr:HAD family hydrolase [Acidobacteriota bacterium]
MTHEPQRAIFLDRDGTLIEEIGHLHQIQDVCVYPETYQAVRKINESEFLAIVVTNQSAIARGFLTEKELEEIHLFIQNDFRQEEAWIDAFYYCPHHPEAGTESYTRECPCRKPKPGMLLQAAEELNLALSPSHMIGDKLIDVEAGHRAGCQSVLIKSEHNTKMQQHLDEEKVSTSSHENPLQIPDHIASNILGAVDWIMEHNS